ncbi:MAG: adenine deaminase [Bacteroidales bacterium]|nr:adenine deaminase [Bacteroidales bacterium]MDZ4203986.1 adenine deaminase [Bacteroidales bacterium]
MKTTIFRISGNIIDVVSRRIFPGTIVVKDGKIQQVIPGTERYSTFLIPGLVDAHVHIESSMLVPSEFARIAVVHGTVGVVSDPHEIANVMGLPGVKFMIDNGKKVPFRFFFGAPSCVPATSFETSGTVLGINEVEEMLDWKEVFYLSEMMNFPGVLFDDTLVKAKLQAALNRHMVIDGHAPGLRGKDAEKYVGAGITTDHECYTLEEAREKASYGMKILIREGSAARNFDELLPILAEQPHMVMFCSDDKHPDELIEGHINKLVARAIQQGHDIIDVISACTLNPATHYGLDNGLLQPGDNADFIVVDSPDTMNVLETYIGGMKVAANGKTLIDPTDIIPINCFNASNVSPEDFEIEATGTKVNVIEIVDGQLVTKNSIEEATLAQGKAVSDITKDVLKMVVLNRYRPSKPAIGFVKNIGLKKGALASTVAHDSHNIIAVGSDDLSLARAIHLLIATKGGIALTDGCNDMILPLPVAGLMAIDDVHVVAEKYRKMTKEAKLLGCTLSAPYMTLSFLALLVIPELKMSDLGLFDSNKFEFIPVFTN